MDDVKECRICHKGDIYGVKGVMLTCGQCKRHTHHSCLVPPMTDGHLVILLKAVTGPAAPQFGHPKVWMCPRCFSRNPEAANKTVIGKELCKSKEQSSSVHVSQPGPSAWRKARAYTPSRIVPSAHVQDSRKTVLVADEDVDVEIIDLEAPLASSHSTAFSTQRTMENDVMVLDSDDDVQVISGPTLDSSSSRQTSRVPPRRTRVDEINRAQTLVSRSDSSTATAPQAISPAIVPPPDNESSHVSAGSSYSGQANPLVNSSRSRRRKVINAYYQSDSSEGTSDERHTPEKRPRLSANGHSTLVSQERLSADAPPPLTVTSADIRMIHAKLRAEGKIAPLPTNYYSINRDKSKQRWSRSSSTAQRPGSSTPATGSAAEIRSHRRVPHIPSDDSDMEELPTRLTSREYTQGVKDKGRARTPLFMLESDNEQLPSGPHSPPRLGTDVKGKGRARSDSDEEEQVAVKLEALENLGLGSESRPESGGAGAGKKTPVPDPTEMFAPQAWTAYHQTMEGDENEDVRALSNDKFRIVEKNENDEISVKRKANLHGILRLRMNTPEREELIGSAGVQLVKRRDRFQLTSQAIKKEIPSWML
ncbi:hypothetical protein BDY19DRAFT_476656 [Irpex rosettiformis]|uniref:Uncharacterized protein n=1 Tax=Irpex rosettiformis TaxID=378272 RepID=A0ACB8TS02_9APHY|nr:hypothetical protein BDY19DRAFT_476656 [Irpex rosettiformis]